MIIGLTGGIGSGKTTVGKMFEVLGVPVYYSDDEAKALMESSEELILKIKGLLGPKAYKDKRLNKKYISEQVFENKPLLKKLNEIVHPAVKKHFKKWQKKQKAPYVIQEAAILFENGSYQNYDKMILVIAPIAERIKRIQQRDGSTKKEILARMENQLRDEEKIALSDFVITNTDLEKTNTEVEKIHLELKNLSSSAKF